MRLYFNTAIIKSNGFVSKVLVFSGTAYHYKDDKYFQVATYTTYGTKNWHVDQYLDAIKGNQAVSIGKKALTNKVEANVGTAWTPSPYQNSSAFDQFYDADSAEGKPQYINEWRLQVPLPSYMKFVGAGNYISFTLVVEVPETPPGKEDAKRFDFKLDLDTRTLLKSIVTYSNINTVVRGNQAYWKVFYNVIGYTIDNWLPYFRLFVGFSCKASDGALGYYGAEEFGLHYDVVLVGSLTLVRPTPTSLDPIEGGQKENCKPYPIRRRSI